MFVNIQSSWLSNKNTCMGNWHSLFWGCSQILSNNDSNIVLNNYKQFDHVCGETVCAYWSWTHLLSNKYKQFHRIHGQTVCAYWSWTHLLSNKYKQFHRVRGQTVCTYWSWTHLISNKYKQFHHVCSQTVCAHWSWTHIVSNKYNQFTLYMVMSPLSLWRDSFITLDLNDFFRCSVLMYSGSHFWLGGWVVCCHWGWQYHWCGQW